MRPTPAHVEVWWLVVSLVHINFETPKITYDWHRFSPPFYRRMADRSNHRAHLDGEEAFIEAAVLRFHGSADGGGQRLARSVLGVEGDFPLRTFDVCPDGALVPAGTGLQDLLFLKLGNALKIVFVGS